MLLVSLQSHSPNTEGVQIPVVNAQTCSRCSESCIVLNKVGKAHRARVKQYWSVRSLIVPRLEFINNFIKTLNSPILCMCLSTFHTTHLSLYLTNRYVPTTDHNLYIEHFKITEFLYVSRRIRYTQSVLQDCCV